MYVVDSGYVVLFGSDPIRPERVLVRRANDSFGDDIVIYGCGRNALAVT